MTGMLIVGLLAAGGAGGMLPHTENTHVFYPHDTAQGPVQIGADGVYAVWLYAPVRAASSVTIADTAFSVQPDRAAERRAEMLWRQAGSLDLAAGPVDIACGDGIVLLALSKQPDFNPETALSDVRAAPFEVSVRDARAETFRHTNTVFTLPHYETLDAWEAAAAVLRKRILLGSGLYPLPERTPLNVRIFDETVHEGYAVAKVHFEPWPGFLATGNLYRPLGDGPFPGVINPHGHWEKGRLEDSERGSVPARCITMARMGAVAFSYDMIGYVDSRQTAHNWGSTRDKLWGIHTFGIQLWTSIRALDFMEELPYVDKERLACVGASGGGTQTFALTAIDPRVKVAAPVNMISSTMQGGCLCENAPVLRLDNSNMEIGALAAPRPLLLVSATGDWTRETPRVEFPAIRSIYALYGAEENIENVHLDYGHNFNLPSREAVYRFLGKHLLGGDYEEFTEPDYVKPPEEALRVFPGEDPPEGYLSGDALVASFIEQARQRRDARVRRIIEGDDAPSPETFAALLGVETPHPNRLTSERFSMQERDDYVLEKWVISRADVGDAVPALLYRSKDAAPQDAVILVHGRGKIALVDLDNGGPGPIIRAHLDKGTAVLAIDAFLLGDHHGPEGRRVRASAGVFQDTFQVTDTGCRIQDILTARAFLAARYDMTGVVDLVGLETGGLWCLFAGAVDAAFREVHVDMHQFDIDDDSAWEAAYYVPGLRALGDVPAALAAGGPARFQISNMRPNAEMDALSGRPGQIR